MFNEDVALRSDLINYIEKFGVEPKDLKNLDLTNLYTIPVINNNNWLAYKIATNAEGLSIPYRNNRGNILGNIAVDDNELITFGQVKSLIKNPFTPKGEVNYVTDLPTNASVGWLYTVLNPNQPEEPNYDPNYPLVNGGDMVIYLIDEITSIGYWDSFSGFVDLSVLNLQKVTENGNITNLPATFGQKLTVSNPQYDVELNTYLEQGFLTIKKLTETPQQVNFGMKNWNTTNTNTKILFNSSKELTETVAYESSLLNLVSYKIDQVMSEEDKMRARKNIGVDSIGFEWSKEDWI